MPPYARVLVILLGVSHNFEMVKLSTLSISVKHSSFVATNETHLMKIDLNSVRHLMIGHKVKLERDIPK